MKKFTYIFLLILFHVSNSIFTSLNLISFTGLWTFFIFICFYIIFIYSVKKEDKFIEKLKEKRKRKRQKKKELRDKIDIEQRNKTNFFKKESKDKVKARNSVENIEDLAPCKYEKNGICNLYSDENDYGFEYKCNKIGCSDYFPKTNKNKS